MRGLVLQTWCSIPIFSVLNYKELDILHALRGFCAFYVVVFHAKFILWSGGAEYLTIFPRATWSPLQYLAFGADMLSSAGFEMVVFFFVLSGFFIRYAQLRKPRPVLRFYLNRIVRIYPPYLASLALAAAVLAYLAYYHPALMAPAAGRELSTGLRVAWHETRQVTVPVLAKTLAFLKSGEYFFAYNKVYWSLLPEALFYLAVPFAFRQVRVYYALSVVLYIFGVIAGILHLNIGFLVEQILLYNGFFALGSWLYDVVIADARWLAFFRRVSGLGLLVGVAALFAVLIGASALHKYVFSGAVASVLAVVSISALLAGRVDRQNPLIRGFHEIGIFSFSLYLYHFPLLLLCYAGLVAYTGHLAIYARYYWLAMPLVTAGCYLLYYITERPAVRFFRGT